MNTHPRWIVGLDLGPTGQFTAPAVLERFLVEEPAPVGTVAFRYVLRHLQRSDPGTPYATIIAAVRELLSTPALQHSLLGVDQTGVGRVVKAALLVVLGDQTGRSLGIQSTTIFFRLELSGGGRRRSEVLPYQRPRTFVQWLNLIDDFQECSLTGKDVRCVTPQDPEWSLSQDATRIPPTAGARGCRVHPEG